MKKYTAELIGTFALTLVVILTSSTMPALTPFLAALTLGLFVYTIGPVSGAHINPAITLGALSIKKIDGRDALFYIISQFLGAGAALITGGFMLQAASKELNVNAPFLPDFFGGEMGVGLAEALGAFFFAFGIASVIYGKTPKDASGAVIGGSLLIGISIASTVSAGILNPAVALGVNALNLMYLLGPIVGAVAGMWAYKAVSH
jgi:aquaporin Z